MKRAWQTGLLLALAALGCDGGSAAVPTATPPAGIKRRAVTELPKIGDYQPPLDESRLEVAPPAGWTVKPKGRTYLMAFASGKENDLTRITISAEDAPAGLGPELTEENVASAAAKLDQDLHKAVADNKKRMEEFSLPIILGETVYIRHVRQATQGGAPCIVQSLATIKNSRLYTVELIVEIDAPRATDYEPSLVKYRDYGYAVAANMRFAQPGEKFDPLAGVKLPEAKAEKTPPPKGDKTPADDKTKAPPPADSKAKTTPPTKPPAAKSPAVKTEPKPKTPTPAATDKTKSAPATEDKTP